MKQTELIGHRLKLQHLKVVMAVAEWGSMAKAAKHLAITQPVVSKVIADLEDVLGVRLFDRSSRGVEPTPYGRALLKRSIAIFDDLRTSVDEIKFMADPTAGELRVGSTEPLLAGLGAAVMERLWQQYPRINFQVVEADSATLLNRDLPERRIELAIVPLLKTSVSEDLEAAILFQDHLRLVVGMKSRWADRRRVTLGELIDEPWCVAPSAIGSLIADAFLASGLKMPRIAMTTTNAHLLFQLLESGRFVGHFGDRLLHFYMNRFALKKLPIDLPIQPFAVAIITLKNRTISPVAQLFIDCAREVARPLAKRQSRSAGSWTGRKEKRSGDEPHDVPRHELLVTKSPD
jgi:DNA-binding transcriptional LysR family regulator